MFHHFPSFFIIFHHFSSFFLPISGPWNLNSGAASVIVTVGNPLLADFVGCNYDLGTQAGKIRNKGNQTSRVKDDNINNGNSTDAIHHINNLNKIIKDNINIEYVSRTIDSFLRNKQNNNKNIKLKDYVFDDKKYPAGKNTVEQLFKSDDVTHAIKTLNENFSILTGIPENN